MWAKQNKKGFTIVELLIVIVVIGILAAITIVAYNGIQNRANDAVVSSDLANIAKKIELYNVDNGLYSDNWAADSVSSGLYKVAVTKSAYATTPAAEFNLLYCTNSAYTTFAVTAMSKSGKRLYITNGSSVKEYTGSTNWSTTTDYGSICTSVLSSSASRGSSGYRGNDSTTGPWRSWTN